MGMALPPIIYEDDALLGFDKPSGLLDGHMILEVKSYEGGSDSF